MNKLKEIRKQSGFTKSDVAYFLDMTAEGVGYLEKSKGIKAEKALILSKLYSVPVEEIIIASMEQE